MALGKVLAFPGPKSVWPVVRGLQAAQFLDFLSAFVSVLRAPTHVPLVKPAANPLPNVCVGSCNFGMVVHGSLFLEIAKAARAAFT